MAVWTGLAVAPVLAVGLLAYALRPARPDVAPIRLAILRAALAVAAYAVLAVEVAGAFGGLRRPIVGGLWLVALSAAAVAVALRQRRDGRVAAALRQRRDGRVAAALRQRRDGRVAAAGDRVLAALRARGASLRGAGSLVQALAVGLLALLVAELVVALLAEPNNYDSLTYHLPRIERWVAAGDVGFFATAIHRQVTLAPGAEYLLLHLRLLTGGDDLYPLLQWTAGLGCLLAVTRIVAQLGGSARAQWLAAFLAGSTPMVTLQATSTQNDLVVAAWVAAAATLALDGLAGRAGPAEVLGLGAATGLTAVTKYSGLLGVGPMLVLWGVAQLRLPVRPPGEPPARPAAGQLGLAADAPGELPARPAAGQLGLGVRPPGELSARAAAGRVARAWRGYAGTALAGVGVLAVAAILVAPFLGRVWAEFGEPLGPARLTESVPMQRHDPAAVLVNGLRVAHTALDTPVAGLRTATAGAIGGLARALGVDPHDRQITFGQTVFPVQSWYPDEDRVAFPITGTLALIGVALALVRPRRLVGGPAGRVRAYAAAVATAGVLYAATVKWQPWGNRLLLFALVLGVPLAGLWLDAVLRRPAADRPAAADRAAAADRQPAARRPAVVAVVGVLAVAALSGALAIGYGFPRRLVGTGSVFTTGDWETRFLRRPHWAADFRWAADQVRAAGVRRVGLVEQNDNFEYPWWLLLRDDHEIVALQSVVPRHPPADPRSVDVVICTGDPKACARHVPAGWRLRFHGYAGVALPPGR